MTNVIESFIRPLVAATLINASTHVELFL